MYKKIAYAFIQVALAVGTQTELVRLKSVEVPRIIFIIGMQAELRPKLSM